jgi:hypothetical protein
MILRLDAVIVLVCSFRCWLHKENTSLVSLLLLLHCVVCVFCWEIGSGDAPFIINLLKSEGFAIFLKKMVVS